MAGAARKAKLSTYTVTIKREIEHVAFVDVDARSAEEAIDVANSLIDSASSDYWNEVAVLGQTAKAKVKR